MPSFNPGFSFDLGSKAPAQSAWDFADALKSARRDGAGVPVEERISKRVARPGRKQAAEAAEASSDEEDDEQLLPGEEDFDAEAGSDDDVSEHDSAQLDAGSSDEEASDATAVAAEDVPSTADKDRRSSHQRAGPRPAGEAAFFASTPEGTKYSANGFQELQLSRPLLKACTALGFTQPTPIQAACIPVALMGRDISGSAITGSGKTAAFALPILERLLFRDRRVSATYALVLTPTRELAVQVHSMIQRLAQHTDVRLALVVGGLSLQTQATSLRARPEIVVATPGRLIDHLRNTASVSLEELAFLVLDEADRLLDMGFSDEVNEIVRLAPRARQTILFSATMTDEVKSLATLSLRQPVRLAADEPSTAPVRLAQEVLRLKGAKAACKEAALLALASDAFKGGRTIIFFATKQAAHRARLQFGLAELPPAAELHGNLTQAQRLEALDSFRQGKAAFLLATDVAARGLDILGVQGVINYDAPADLRGYLHRVGRTARAGAAGRALTMVEDGDRPLIREVMKKGKAQLLERQLPWSQVQRWHKRVEAFEGDLQQLLQEEREERALRQADMEAQKATNMMEHEAEIAQRPARTWFQTPREKEQAARKPELDNSAAKKKAKAAEKAALKGKRKREADAEAGDTRAKRSSVRKDTQDSSMGVRITKARESAAREAGLRPSTAKQKKPKSGAKKQDRKKPQSGRSGERDSSLFQGDGTSRPPAGAKVYAGGGRSGKLRTAPAKSSVAKRKGNKAFKSKKRHKRR